jgi:hypothetical protein
MPSTSARATASSSRTSLLFSTRELQANGLISPNTPKVNQIRLFIERHAMEAIAATAEALGFRYARLAQEIEERKVYAFDTGLRRGKTCPVGQRMRLLNAISEELALPEVYPGLRSLDDSVAP